MNLEERVRSLQSAGDVDAAKQLVRAAISSGGRAEYRLDGDSLYIVHPGYTGTHEVRRRPYGESRVVARGDYRFRGETGSVDIRLSAVNSKAVRFGTERIRETETEQQRDGRSRAGAFASPNRGRRNGELNS